MTVHADDPHPSPAPPGAPEARQIDLVLFGDRRLGVPQQVARAATLFQRQFGRPPTVVGLSPAAVEPPYPAQIAGVPVRVRAQIPAGYLWVVGAGAPRAEAPAPAAPRPEPRSRRPGQPRRDRADAAPDRDGEPADRAGGGN